MYADITQLLDAGREARQRKKRRRTAQQMRAELHMCAHYINEERLTQTTRQLLFPPLLAGDVAYVLKVDPKI